jgi:hypothetical protein
LLRLVDQLEENEKFSSFFHDSQFLTHESYQDISRREAKHNLLLQEERKKSCDHLRAGKIPAIPSSTSVCEDCEKEGMTGWIGLRL